MERVAIGRINIAHIERWLGNAAVKAAQRVAALRHLAVDVGCVQVIYHSQGRVVGNERVRAARLNGCRIRVAIIARTVKVPDCAVGALQFNLFKHIFLGAVLVDGCGDVGLNGSRRNAISFREDRGNLPVRGIHRIGARETGAMQVRVVVHVVLRIHRIHVLRLRAHIVVRHQIRRGFCRVACGERIAIHVVNV